MGANEDLTNLLNAPNREDFLISMDVDNAYHVDVPWHAIRETIPSFDPTKKAAPQHCHYVDASSPTSPSFSTVDHLYSFGDVSLVGGSDAFGQNFLSETLLEASNPLSEAPVLCMDPSVYSRVCSLPPPNYQRCISRPLYADVEFDAPVSNHPTAGHESESTNSSLETTFQLTDSFIAQERPGLCTISNQPNVSPSPITPVISSILDFKPLEPSLFNPTMQSIKVESGNLPTMLIRPPHTLPQMTPPMLPKLCAGSAALYLPPSQFLDSGWEVDAVGVSTFGGNVTHPESKRDDHSTMHKSHSTPTISCFSRHSTGCNLFCNASISALSKRPKKPYIGKLTPEERKMKIMRYRQKRNLRKFDRGVTYQCRKTLADRRPRVRGRFARNNDIHATFPSNKSTTAKV